jgi:hypothetical protein
MREAGFTGLPVQGTGYWKYPGMAGPLLVNIRKRIFADSIEMV